MQKFVTVGTTRPKIGIPTMRRPVIFGCPEGRNDSWLSFIPADQENRVCFQSPHAQTTTVRTRSADRAVTQA
jgi:hypothetical protein